MKNIQVLFVVLFTLFSSANAQEEAQDSLIQRDFDGFVAKFYSTPMDTLFHAKSSEKYQVHFVCSNSFSERYAAQNLWEGFGWFKLYCNGELKRDDREIRTVLTDSVLVGPMGYFKNVSVTLFPQAFLESGYDLELVSFENGKYLVIRSKVILQHGGETCWGNEFHYYMERL